MFNKLIKEHTKLVAKVKELKNSGKKIVFTNGCFDIIHPGHVEYLYKAKSLGDILIIGINSDKSVKKIKGDKRPILNENDRALILSAFFFVDYITIFEEETPYNLIKKLIPDVLVKGGDWEIENIVGKDIVEKNGGKVVTINYKNGYSTTNIINKIKKLYCNRREEWIFLKI